MLCSSGLLFTLLWLHGRCASSLRSPETYYKEQLNIEYLAKDSVLTELRFSMALPSSKQQDGPFHILGPFPHLIYSTIHDLDIAEGRLSFARGRWNEALWGEAPFDTTSNGFQLHLWLKAAPETQ
jgi:hypothetical protein